MYRPTRHPPVAVLKTTPPCQITGFPLKGITDSKWQVSWGRNAGWNICCSSLTVSRLPSDLLLLLCVFMLDVAVAVVSVASADGDVVDQSDLTLSP